MRRERRSLGPGATGGVSSLISGMTLRERRQLHEAIKRRILQEGGDEDTWEPVTGSGGAQITDGGRVEKAKIYYIYVKDKSGKKWEISVPDIGQGNPYILDLDKPLPDGKYAPYAKDETVSGQPMFEDIYGRLAEEVGTIGGSFVIREFLLDPPSALRRIGLLQAASDKNATFSVDIGRGSPVSLTSSEETNSPATPPPTAPAPPPTATAQGGPSYIGANTWSGVYKIPDKPIVASESAIGLEIFDSAGNILMVKTQQGWRIRAKLADDEVLAMVVPAAREEVAKGLRLRGAGLEYDILKRNLIDQTNANKETELTLRREGNYWIDPFPINDTKAQQIIDQLGDALRVKRDVRELQVTTDKLYLGDAYFVFDGNTVTIKIPYSENNAGFVDIFGADKNIDAAIAKTQRRIGKDKPLKIPVAGATERSIIRMMTPSILGPLGIGAITFTPDERGTYTSKPITMNAEQLKKFRELFSTVNS